MNDDRYLRLERTFIRRGRMADALAVVGGTGALGNEVAKCLAMLGCGRILLVDLDTIEKHNATRSVLLCVAGDLDDAVAKHTPKAAFVAAGINQINPDVRVGVHIGDITELGAGILRDADMVFSTFDNFRARFILNARCAEAGRVMFDGGLGNRGEDVCSGSVCAYDAQEGPCFSCGLGAKLRARLQRELSPSPRVGCGPAGVALEGKDGVPSTPMMASIVGGAQALMGVKHTMGARGFTAKPGVLTRWHLAGTPTMEQVTLRRDLACERPHRPLRRPDVRLARSSENTTLDDLVLEARRYLGGPVRLDMPMEVTDAVECSQCKRRFEVWMTWSKLQTRACADCGGSLRGVGDIRPAYVPSAGTHTGQTLRDIGFPLGQGFKASLVEDGDDGGILIELARDLDRLFAQAPRSAKRAQQTQEQR